MLEQLIQSEGPKELYPDHWPQVVMIERLLPRFVMARSAARPGLQQPVVMPSARAASDDVHRLMN
eukprot:COSAG01_NODE_46463_length_400_cov_0.485050_2_plen_64_part_01